MTPEQILFLIVAFVTLAAALCTVTVRNLVHSALWLVLTLFGVAVFFVLLNAGFLAVAQVVVYIGAIAILIIFAIMLTQGVAKVNRPQLNANWGWVAVLSLVFCASLTWVLAGWGSFSAQAPDLSPKLDSLRQLGEALVAPNAFVLPFEVASVLLLAALIGAIIVAFDKK